LKRIDNIIETIESGKGNIGKFIKDDALYAQIHAILGELQMCIFASEGDILVETTSPASRVGYGTETFPSG